MFYHLIYLHIYYIKSDFATKYLSRCYFSIPSLLYVRQKLSFCFINRTNPDDFKVGKNYGIYFGNHLKFTSLLDSKSHLAKIYKYKRKEELHLVNTMCFWFTKETETSSPDVYYLFQSEVT